MTSNRITVLAIVAFVLLAWFVNSQFIQPRLRSARQEKESLSNLLNDGEEMQPRTEQQFADLKNKSTQQFLQLLGESLVRMRAVKNAPPQAKDFEGTSSTWISSRDDKPFVVLWEIDPAKLPNGGSGTLLAWESTTDNEGGRYVLMADEKTVKYMQNEEFEKTPRAREP